jgi:hypothetical protein
MKPTVAPLLITAGILIAVCPSRAAAAAFLPDETLLQDDIKYTIHWDGSYSFEEDVAVRLNTEAAVTNDGESYIGYSGSQDTVKILAAYTQTPDHTRHDVSADKIMDQQGGDSDDDSFSDQQEKAIIFPALTVGAIKHYHYVIDTSQSEFPGQFFDIQNFDTDTQTQSARITVIAPSALKLYFQPVGMQGGAAAPAKPGLATYIYTLNNIPPQATEQDSVDPDDYSPRLGITTFPDWPSVGAAYEGRAAPKAKITPAVQHLADQITSGLTDPYARARALYNWVSRNIRYVSVDIGDSGYVPNPADQIIDAGYGDCKDHVTLLKALLAAKGIPSSGTLVNWDYAYAPMKIAMPEFNHIITYIPQFNLFVDSTAQFAPFGTLPSLERGKQALITGAPGIPSRIVTLPLSQPAAPDFARMVTHEVLGPDGAVTGSAVISDSGRYEENDREHFADIDPGTETQAATELMQRFDIQGTGSLAPAPVALRAKAVIPPGGEPASDPHDLSTPFGYTTSFSMPGYAAIPGPGTMPVPIGVPALNALAGLIRYAALPTRNFALPCLAIDNQETTFLLLPATLTIKSLPGTTNFSNAIGTYTASYSQARNEIKVIRNLQTHPEAATCSPADYQLLRAISFAIGRDFRATISYESKTS